MTTIPITHGHVGTPRIYIVDSGNAALIEIQFLVARAFRVNTVDLHQRTRALKIVWPRMVAMFLGKECSVMTWELADFWKCNHGTIYNACRVVQARMDVEPRFKAIVDGLRKQTEGL